MAAGRSVVGGDSCAGGASDAGGASGVVRVLVGAAAGETEGCTGGLVVGTMTFAGDTDDAIVDGAACGLAASSGLRGSSTGGPTSCALAEAATRTTPAMTVAIRRVKGRLFSETVIRYDFLNLRNRRRNFPRGEKYRATSNNNYHRHKHDTGQAFHSLTFVIFSQA